MYYFIITIFFLIANILIARDDLVRVATVTQVQGEAVLFSDYYKQAMPVAAKARIFASDTLTAAPNSTVTAHINKKTKITLFRRSSMTFNSRWHVVQRGGEAAYSVNRTHPSNAFEVVADFATLYATASRFTIRDEEERTVSVQEGSLELRNFSRPFRLHSSDPRCGKPFRINTPSFFLSAGETAEFIDGHVVKSCGKIPDTLQDVPGSLVLNYLPARDGALCSADCKELDKTSDINRVMSIPTGCILRLETRTTECTPLARNNTLYAIYRHTSYGIEMELIPLHRDKEAFAQFICR